MTILDKYPAGWSSDRIVTDQVPVRGWDLSIQAIAALRARADRVREEIGLARAAYASASEGQESADDIIADYRRGVQAFVDDYEARLAVSFADPAQRNVPALLREGITVYLYRDIILKKIAELIPKLCPQAARGGTRTERHAALAASEDRLVKAWAALGEILRGLSAEKLNLRDLRMSAIHDRDGQLRSNVEGEQRELDELTAGLRALHAEPRHGALAAIGRA